MSTTDYLLNGALIALVVLQLRGRRLTARSLLLPVAIVVFAAVEYLHGIPTAGNDLTLALVGAFAGVALGTACGLATRVFRRADGATVAKAGPLAAALWVAGIGSRIAFALYSSHGGGREIERFSTAHHITSVEAWVACLILMALCEVLTRTATIGLKFRRTAGAPQESGARHGVRSYGPSSIMGARGDG
jgi:hypothetical protein